MENSLNVLDLIVPTLKCENVFIYTYVHRYNWTSGGGSSACWIAK